MTMLFLDKIKPTLIILLTVGLGGLGWWAYGQSAAPQGPNGATAPRIAEQRGVLSAPPTRSAATARLAGLPDRSDKPVDQHAARHNLVQVLIHLLKGDNANLRNNALIVLTRLGRDSAPALGKLLHRDDRLLRPMAIMALTQISWQEAQPALPELAELFKDPDMLVQALRETKLPRVRQAACWSVRYRGAKAVPTVLGLLNSKDPLIRSNALFLLGELGANAQGALPTLTRMLLTTHHSPLTTRHSIDPSENQR